jgi:hypothetical protein
MSRDELVSLGLIGSFACLVTAHVALLAALAFRKPRWRALVALIAPPAAPVWGWRHGMRARALAWFAGAMAYAGCLWLASR